MERSDDPSSPFFLHTNENPSLVLTSTILTGNNYHFWSRSMKMTLISKNKLKFVNGFIPVPSDDDPIFSAWERCNTMVLSWLVKSLSPLIAQSVIWIDYAQDMWKDLYDRFAQGDAVRISDLQEEISSLKQGDRSVTDYFTQLKILWDELMNFRPTPICMCIPQCNCNAFEIIRKYNHQDYVIHFLKGLNPNFSTVKLHILLINHIPSINKVFALALQHER